MVVGGRWHFLDLLRRPYYYVWPGEVTGVKFIRLNPSQVSSFLYKKTTLPQSWCLIDFLRPLSAPTVFMRQQLCERLGIWSIMNWMTKFLHWTFARKWRYESITKKGGGYCPLPSVDFWFTMRKWLVDIYSPVKERGQNISSTTKTLSIKKKKKDNIAIKAHTHTPRHFTGPFFVLKRGN